jgi:PhzF family phenazine biosynthesis protein
MKSFRFKKIDAFTGGYAPGNPAGCVYLNDAGDITDEEMQEIARQLKGFVSEVAYVFPEGEGFFLKYYSSEREVDFCGHATVAAMHDLFARGGEQRGDEIPFRVGEEKLAARYDRASGSVFIAAPEPEYLPMDIEIDEIARVLGITLADLDARYGVARVETGLDALLVPMRLAGKLTDVLPEMERLTDFCIKHNLDIIVLYTDDHILAGADYRTRVLAPRFGYLEDPATGSGNAALGNWLLKEGFWKKDTITIEQGRSYRAPNIIRLKTAEIDGKTRVLFGGGATVRIEGSYLLH